MTITPTAIPMQFDEAQRLAEEHDLPTYSEWRNGLERRYTVMPIWYWDETRCRENYAEHVQSSLAWQAQQAENNRLSLGLFSEIGRAAQ